MYNIMGLSENVLRKVIPKLPATVIARLLTAYPRSIGQTLMSMLAVNASPSTIQFVREEIQSTRTPSFSQIREAELELIKAVYAEQRISPVADSSNIFPYYAHPKNY
jgi:hypothetical protein